MKTIQIEIRKENYSWLETIAKLCKKTPEELIEKLVNQKIEENMTRTLID